LRATDTGWTFMADDNDRAKLDELADKIRKAETEAGIRPQEAEGEEKGGSLSAANMASDFAASVVVGALLGWVIDDQFGTLPWGTIVMVFFGFAAGAKNVWRKLNEKDKRAAAPEGEQRQD
jgi:ATP synthase protein I